MYLYDRFSTMFSRGNFYIVVFYDYDSNGIFLDTMKIRLDEEMVIEFKKVVYTFITRGFQTKLNMLDKKLFAALNR